MFGAKQYVDDRIILDRCELLVCGLVRRELSRLRGMTFCDSITEPSVDVSVPGTFDVKLHDAFCDDFSDIIYDVDYAATVSLCGRVLLYELSVLACQQPDASFVPDVPFPDVLPVGDGGDD